ncbi:MAG: sigma-70 family RNA polymerase sigma factor [Planctomycetota bacterium]|nr:sigma-70 family RNA polymerase sigma factor [Planctomycetota bacterium]
MKSSRPSKSSPAGDPSQVEGASAEVQEPVGPTPRQVDEGLVRRAQLGEEEAFAELVGRHQSRAWRVARGLVRSDEDAQDIAQEAFMRVFRGLERFDFKYAFSTWLYRIVTNLAIDHLRKQRGHVSLSGGGDDDESGNLATDLPDHRDERPSDAIVSREMASEVRGILDGLADHFRTALVLREFEGLSCREIAEVVGATQVTVRWRLHRGRKLFLEAWNRKQEGDGAKNTLGEQDQAGPGEDGYDHE